VRLTVVGLDLSFVSVSVSHNVVGKPAIYTYLLGAQFDCRYYVFVRCACRVLTRKPS